MPVSELEPNSDEPISMSSSLGVVLAEGYDQGRCQRIGVSDSLDQRYNVRLVRLVGFWGVRGTGIRGDACGE